MSFAKVPAGKDVPNEVNVVIEIPALGGPIKYEVDKDYNMLVVDRLMATSMVYPANYGYVPQTLSEDGDPVDVLVVTPHPLQPCSVVRARPVGMLAMTDESGPDAKILAVPVDKLTKIYSHVESHEDLGVPLLESVQHFFESYKALESGKWVKIDGWKGVDAAKKEIEEAVARYK